MSDEQDTDTALALLASLLAPAEYPLDRLMDALVGSKGDVQNAAESLLLPRIKSSGKRKAGTSLESWLNRSQAAPKEQPSPKRLRTPSTPPKAKAPAVNLLDVLKQPKQEESSKPKATPQPALLLTSQEALDKHGLPLTLLRSPLSPALASALYLAMMEESEQWDRNRWYLAGRWVESPHLMTTYARKDGGYGDEENMSKYYYAGSEMAVPKTYPALLAQAAEEVEKAVNESLDKRKRWPLEWAGPWKANFCGANRYDGANSSVGWHTDQLTYLGPCTTIASLSLGTPRAFRLRETGTVDEAFSSGKPIRTYEVNLGHNSLVLMNAGCQERYKHT